ncbi:tetratricopeptide repeat protein [Treponema sp.]|uniref:tetratricopeptide repeat protein n=1 Tax=Treponema sp. TaxID=166 RepID=UPI003EFEE6AD
MKNSFIKFLSAFYFLLFFAWEISAAPKKTPRGQEDWRSLQKAKTAFEANDFGAAVRLAEQARELRIKTAQWQTHVLDESLKNSKVRRAGDSIERVLPILKELNFSDAIGIVSEYVERYGADFFSKSYSNLIAFVAEREHYPEADFLLGKIYRLEGEYNAALNYMKNAYNYAVNLDVPLEKFDILYELAGLYRDLGNFDEYEKYLLVIASEDSVFTSKGYVEALLHVVNSDAPDSLEKFFLLYRCDDPVGLKAFADLGKLYMEENEIERALKFNAFASIVAVTKIENVLSQRTNGFRYSDFRNLLSLCSAHDDIVEWGIKNNVWELFCCLADSAAVSGKIQFSTSLFRILSETSPVDYWKNYASERIIR